METPIILIEVNGGCIVNIMSTTDIKIKILDHDNLGSVDDVDAVIETSFYEADSIETPEEIENYFNEEVKIYQK